MYVMYLHPVHIFARTWALCNLIALKPANLVGGKSGKMMSALSDYVVAVSIASLIDHVMM